MSIKLREVVRGLTLTIITNKELNKSTYLQMNLAVNITHDYALKLVQNKLTIRICICKSTYVVRNTMLAMPHFAEISRVWFMCMVDEH